MTKQEFEKKIKELNLEKVHREGKIQTYSKSQKEYYIDYQKDNLYGCYFDEEDNEYVIFFTDAERGIIMDLGQYKTEDEAYDKLFKTIKEWEEEYKKENM